MRTWPELEYSDWKPTYETLHRWLQIIGKIRLANSPWTNHSWHSTLYLTSRGLSTGPIPMDQRTLSIDIDFFDHKVIFTESTGRSYVLGLFSESVSSFYKRVLRALSVLEVNAEFDPHPNECPDYIAFDEDILHDSYVPEQAQNCFQVMVRAANVMQLFRSTFVGKTSPVHFFWGAFDLAVTRFSGRVAPEHPGLAPHVSPIIMKEAYSHEVSSCGFWPGNEMYPQAAFYSYTYPTPNGFDRAVTIDGAFYHSELGEYILPYGVVRNASDPGALLLRFFQETYVAAAELGNWDRERLEESPFLHHLQSKQAHQFSKWSPIRASTFS